MFKNASVTIIVDDLKKVAQFYVETLGLKEQFKVEGHLVQVEAPKLAIGLLQPGEGQDFRSGKLGRVQIGLEVEELDQAIKLLKSRGIVFQPTIDGGAARLAYFSDPEGNPLYLIELKSEFDR